MVKYTPSDESLAMLDWLLRNLPRLMISKNKHHANMIDTVDFVPWDKNQYDKQSVTEAVRGAMLRGNRHE